MTTCVKVSVNDCLSLELSTLIRWPRWTLTFAGTGFCPHMNNKLLRVVNEHTFKTKLSLKPAILWSVSVTTGHKKDRRQCLLTFGIQYQSGLRKYWIASVPEDKTDVPVPTYAGRDRPVIKLNTWDKKVAPVTYGINCPNYNKVWLVVSARSRQFIFVTIS